VVRVDRDRRGRLVDDAAALVDHVHSFVAEVSNVMRVADLKSLWHHYEAPLEVS
jgi:hypothetical protein